MKLVTFITVILIAQGATFVLAQVVDEVEANSLMGVWHELKIQKNEGDKKVSKKIKEAVDNGIVANSTWTNLIQTSKAMVQNPNVPERAKFFIFDFVRQAQQNVSVILMNIADGESQKISKKLNKAQSASGVEIDYKKEFSPCQAFVDLAKAVNDSNASFFDFSPDSDDFKKINATLFNTFELFENQISAYVAMSAEWDKISDEKEQERLVRNYQEAKSLYFVEVEKTHIYMASKMRDLSLKYGFEDLDKFDPNKMAKQLFTMEEKHEAKYS